MVTKRAVAALLLAATLFAVPAYAESSVVSSASSTTTAPSPAAGPVPAVSATSADQVPRTPSESEAGDMDRLDVSYAKGYLADSAKIVTSPLRWEGSDWAKLGVVLGGTSALLLADRGIKNFSQDHKSGVASGFADVGTVFGTYYYMVPAMGGMYLYGHLADDHKARRTALLALESFTITGVLTTTVKTLSSRHRPDTGDSPTTWDGPTLSSKNVSFASGHTSTAFSLATVVADQYQDNPYVPPIAYGLATLTGLSRIYDNQHWSSDVFFGAAIGYFVGKAVLALHKEDGHKGSEGKKGGGSLSLAPEIDKKMKGLTVKYEF